MTEHDGLTAEQEAEQFKRASNVEIAQWTLSAKQAYVNLLWVTGREKARAETYHAAYREALASAEQANLRAREAGERAEAAEARVAELEAALIENAIYMLGPERWRGAILVCRMCARSGPAGGPAQFPSEAKIEHAADCLLFAAPTTEAVTEVEGS